MPILHDMPLPRLRAGVGGGNATMCLLKLLRSPFTLALLTSAICLAIWAALGIGANFGINSVLATAGLAWLVTVGLPTSTGVVLAATVWGRSESFSGLPGFVALASALGLGSQVVTFFALGRMAAKARVNGRPWRIRRALMFVGAGAVLVVVALCITHRPAAVPDRVIDGHAHLFGDEGWPPVHKQTCGLSPAQKANPTYGLLNRLLRLPATGDLNEHYLQALVRQTQEARKVLGNFRMVLLAQDCRYTAEGDPDCTHTTV